MAFANTTTADLVYMFAAAIFARDRRSLRVLETWKMWEGAKRCTNTQRSIDLLLG